MPSPAISAIKLLKNAHLLKINVHENTAQVDSTNHDFPVLTELSELCCNIFNYKLCLAWPGYLLHSQNLMLSCVLAIKTILFLGSLNNLKCSERIRLVPPGDQTISAGGAGAAINGSQATGVFGLSVKLKINFISERTGTGGGRRVQSGGRQLGISQARFVLPSPVSHSHRLALSSLLISNIHFSWFRQGTKIITFS